MGYNCTGRADRRRGSYGVKGRPGCMGLRGQCQRKRTLDSIRDTADQLTEVSRRLDRLMWMAEKDSSDAFLNLADTAGKMTLSSLSQTATLLEILFNTGVKSGEKSH